MARNAPRSSRHRSTAVDGAIPRPLGASRVSFAVLHDVKTFVPRACAARKRGVHPRQEAPH